MDSEHEDYNLDKMLESLNSKVLSENAYKVFRACSDNENLLKDFIQINLNLPMYNKVYKYYAEVVGYTFTDTPVIIIGVTKRDESINHSIWNTFTDKDIIIAKDLDKFIGYKYISLCDIIWTIEDRKSEFVLDF